MPYDVAIEVTNKVFEYRSEYERAAREDKGLVSSGTGCLGTIVGRIISIAFTIFIIWAIFWVIGSCMAAMEG